MTQCILETYSCEAFLRNNIILHFYCPLNFSALAIFTPCRFILLRNWYSTSLISFFSFSIINFFGIPSSSPWIRIIHHGPSFVPNSLSFTWDDRVMNDFLVKIEMRWCYFGPIINICSILCLRVRTINSMKVAETAVHEQIHFEELLVFYFHQLLVF